jgi:hypothetical protein
MLEIRFLKTTEHFGRVKVTGSYPPLNLAFRGTMMLEKQMLESNRAIMILDEPPAMRLMAGTLSTYSAWLRA